MDSQATLVNPTELPDRYAHIEFVFDRDSLTNADLRMRGGTTVVYTIRTTGRSMSRTELCKLGSGSGSRAASTQLLARIERNEVLPDTIAFEGCAPQRIRKWLKHRTFTVSSEDAGAGGEATYVWKPMNLYEIALFNGQNPLEPIAWFRGRRKQRIDGVDVVEMPALGLQPEAERIQHLVLASLLIVEQKYRMKSQHAAFNGPRRALNDIVPGV